MKYIRTKDGIFKRYKNSKIIDGIFYYPDNGIFPEYRREPILKQADTIEELCDEFIGIYKGRHIKSLSKDLWILKDCEVIYGAIWTDKGLIFVARMNSMGELELL